MYIWSHFCLFYVHEKKMCMCVTMYAAKIRQFDLGDDNKQ